jgi:hypothetical protein
VSIIAVWTAMRVEITGLSTLLDKIEEGGITKVNRKLHTTNRSLQTILSQISG